MPTITISRQLGSLGDEVASEIADRLKYTVVSREVINHAARRAQVPEVALATIDDLNLLGLRPSADARSAYHQAVQEIMEEYATQGDAIIIGRAGQVILSGFPNVLHVKVIAPASLRAVRVARINSITIEAAQAQIEASDRSRRNYLRRYYHVRWDDPAIYDLVVNTSRLEPANAACLVCQALSQCFQGTNQIQNAPIFPRNESKTIP